MKRREFIMLLGGAPVVLPLAARAQQPSIPVIGFLGSASPVGWGIYVAAFCKGLLESGFVVGENVTIEYRHSLLNWPICGSPLSSHRAARSQQSLQGRRVRQFQSCLPAALILSGSVWSRA